MAVVKSYQRRIVHFCVNVYDVGMMVKAGKQTAAPGQERLADALTGIRTPVLALKGLRPGPLDDEGNDGNFNTRGRTGQ